MKIKLETRRDKIDFVLFILHYILFVISVIALIANITVIIRFSSYLTNVGKECIINIIISLSIIISFFVSTKFKELRKKFGKVTR